MIPFLDAAAVTAVVALAVLALVRFLRHKPAGCSSCPVRQEHSPSHISNRKS